MYSYYIPDEDSPYNGASFKSGHAIFKFEGDYYNLTDTEDIFQGCLCVDDANLSTADILVGSSMVYSLMSP